MAKALHVTLTGLARGIELDATIHLSTIRPLCLDYVSARVVVFIAAGEARLELVCLTEETALRQIAHWFVVKFGATSVVRRAEFWPIAEAA